MATEVPLSDFHVYTEAAGTVSYCASIISNSYSNSFGCPVINPASCLCTNAKSSLLVAKGIRTCINGGIEYAADMSTATQLWASYCLSNAGVTARDETLIQDIPYYPRVPSYARFCAASATSNAITRYGCTEYTKAPCLCTNSASSQAIVDAVVSCLIYSSDVPSASSLFSSFCEVNLATPATRTPEAAEVSTTPNSEPSASPGSMTITSGPAVTSSTATSVSLDPSTGTVSATSSQSSSSNQETSQNSSSNDNNGNELDTGAIVGIVVGVMSIFVAIGIAWWTDHRNRWLRNLVASSHHRTA